MNKTLLEHVSIKTETDGTEIVNKLNEQNDADAEEDSNDDEEDDRKTLLDDIEMINKDNEIHIKDELDETNDENDTNEESEDDDVDGDYDNDVPIKLEIDEEFLNEENEEEVLESDNCKVKLEDRSSGGYLRPKPKTKSKRKHRKTIENCKMPRSKKTTMREIEEILENWSDEDNPVQCVNVLPPNVHEVSDEELIDENTISINEDQTALTEIAGYLEIETERNIHEDIGDEEVVETEPEAWPSTSKSAAKLTGPPQKKPRVSYKPLSSFGTPTWSRNRGKEEFHYDISPQAAPLTDMQNDLCELLKDLSPIQLFSKFYDGEVLDHIITETNRFAAQNNAGFHLDMVILKRFLGILLISGYHTLPSIESYWSSQLSMGIAIVKQAMSRATFMHVKRYIHFANNDELDGNDKMTKLRPFFDIINRKFKQFGIWSELLSIDEQMVPYFGRHSCKMFILGKPIRFGYKLWCLCSSTGYLFSFIPYCGQSDEYNRELGLGADVILRLLSNVEAPMRHVVFFDNFFTSYHLMCLLKEKGFCATGTVRCNRVAGGAIDMKTDKDLPRGARDYMYDSKNQITLCRWQDNKEVTIATNHDQILPLHPVRRWQKATKASKKSLGENGKFVNVDQPAVLHNYNKGMGGVDLHDNAIQNYRVNIRGKKWYWPLWINTLNSSTVNAWKLHCLVAKYKNEKPMSQKQFKLSVTESLLLTDDKEAWEVDEDLEFQRPRNLPNVVGEHLIVRQPQGKCRRCQLKGCGKPTVWMCEKCAKHMHSKCFKDFHEM